MFEVQDNIQKIRSLIESRKEETIVLRIGGGSGSGKTSIYANSVFEIFKEDSLVITMDDYCVGKKKAYSEDMEGLNWDMPRRFHLDLLEKNISDLKKGIASKKPVFLKSISEPIGFEIMVPKRIIIVEGLFVLNNRFIKNTNDDIKIFIDTAPDIRRQRRVFVDAVINGDGIEEAERYFDTYVEPMHQLYIEPTKKYANFVFKNN